MFILAKGKRGWVVEITSFENWQAWKGLEGSNPSASAVIFK